MTLMAFVVPANSDEEEQWTRPTQHRQFPSGTDIVHEGVEVRCFTVEEGKKIKHLVIDYDDLYYAAIRWEGIRRGLESKIAGLELRLELHQEMVTELQSDRQWWKKLFQAEHKYRMKIEMTIQKKDRWRWVPWTLVVVESLTMGVIGTINATK
jgi:hypothetical protein